ncbi:MAG: substrate-binding periplasmic protein [Alcanivoracaceae bacterium]
MNLRSLSHAILRSAVLLVVVLAFCSAGHARTLLIATSSSIPPYVIADQDRGIVVDILQAALAAHGYRVEFVYAPNRRVERMIEDRQVDGIFNLAAGAMSGVHYSKPIVHYDNVAITLKSFPLHLNQVGDLDGLRLVVFQNAPKFLGNEFGALLLRNPAFQEVSNQRSQVQMLFRERADVIIMERRIFEYFHRELASRGEIGGEYRIHSLFPPAPRYAAFVDPNVRDQFDDGLAHLQQTGRIDQIVLRYLVPLSP